MRNQPPEVQPELSSHKLAGTLKKVASQKAPISRRPKEDRRLLGQKQLTADQRERVVKLLNVLYAGTISKSFPNGNKAELARILTNQGLGKVTPQALYVIMEGGGGIAFDTARKIAKASNVPLSEIMGEDEVLSLASFDRFPNLRICLDYHKNETRWTPAAVAAARAGAFDTDTSPAEWADRLDRLTAHLALAAKKRN